MDPLGHVQWIEGIDLLCTRCGAPDVNSSNCPIFKENGGTACNCLKVGNVSDLDSLDVCKSLHFLVCMLASQQGGS
jgi:hypothetical protein